MGGYLRNDEDGRLWYRHLEFESIVFDPEWSIDEPHVIDIGRTGETADGRTVTLLSKDDVETVGGNPITGCHVLAFHDRYVYDWDHLIVLAPGIGTVRMEGAWGDAQLQSWSFDQDD